MRFMVIRKADEETEAGVLPSTELFDAMARYNEELVKAGVMLAGDGLMATDRGAKVRFSQPGRTTVIDGPFAEAKELVAGFSIIEADSLAEAVEWVKKWPVEDGHGNAEIEIRRVPRIEDFGDAMTDENREGTPATSRHRQGIRRTDMRFMVMIKSDEADRGRRHAAEDGAARRDGRATTRSWSRPACCSPARACTRRRRGARVKFNDGVPTVIDGPFTEAKELVAGFWLLEVKSKEEAIEWVKRVPCTEGVETDDRDPAGLRGRGLR